MSKVIVEADDDYIYIYMPFDENAQAALKEDFQARWDKELRHWYVDASSYTVHDIEKELKLHFPRAFD